MNGFAVYRTYLGIKTHFKNVSYDYFKYGMPKAKVETYMRRRDRHFFEKISKKYTDQQIVNLFVSNFVADENVWVGDMFDGTAESRYAEWTKRMESLEYLFEQDVDVLCNYILDHNLKFDDLFACPENTHPLIVKMVLQKQIMPETYAILDSILKFGEKFNTVLKEDILWKSINCRYNKYLPFLNLGERKKTLRKIALSKLQAYTIA